jgi:hypothetical protein
MGGTGFGYRPARVRLLDEQLHLDPDIVRIIEEIDAKMAARQMINNWLQPNWLALMTSYQSLLSRPSPLLPTPPRAPSPQYTPGTGPATPRPGELGDVIGAVYQLPAVQRIVIQAHDEGHRQVRLLRKEWDEASTGDRVAMVTMTTLVGGSAIGIVLGNQQTRSMAFDLVKGHDIPVPLVDGLSFKLLDRGGGITAPLGVPGLSGSARLQFPAAARPDYEVTVTFDVMEFIHAQH